MKGQFFISSVVVIAVILILSMSYANSAEELRLETGNDLAFDNYKNAYKLAVPDDWEFVNYLSRNKVGICVTNIAATNTTNTTVQFTVNSDCSTELKSSNSIEVSSSSSSCYLFIVPNSFTFDSQNCTTFFVYYDGSSESISVTSEDYDITGTKFSTESINLSPNDQLVSTYREKNIFVNETDETNKVYTVSYRSNTIDYTGEL